MLQNRPAPNLSRGLQGVAPNLNIRMYDGNPMRSPEYNIRGMTSIGAGGNALVLIDGVEGDPSRLNPNDVESISVLKDAASVAIYGARGAFGVVLITTKSAAKGKVSVAYSGNYSINRRTVIPDLVTNGYRWASLFNTAHAQWYGLPPTAINSAFPFSQEYLQELGRRDADPSLPKVEVSPATGKYVYYDNHDWQKDLYKDAHPAMEHALSISGGNDKTSYYISGRYYAQDGIYRYNTDAYKTYNVRAKGDIQVSKWLKVYNNFDFSSVNYDEPLYYGGYSFASEISMGLSMRAFPVVPLLNPDNTITEMGARSVGDFYYGKNKAQTQYAKMNNISGFTASFFDKALKFSGDLAFAIGNSEKTRAYSAVPYSNAPGEITWLGDTRYFNTHGRQHYFSVNLYSEYNRAFGDHTFKGLVGYNYENATERSLEVSRNGLLDVNNPGFSLSNGQVYSTADASNDWAILGGFYRLAYDYKGKYLAEANGRVDGSSKFPKSQRFGFFPSVSVGWRISEETFWPVSKKWLPQVKIRGSYGALGNGNIAPYLYLESMPVGTLTRLINGSYPAYTEAAGVIPDTLTWEKVTTANIGIDLSAFNYRLEVTGDVYQRKTTGMFTTGPTLPEVFGAAVPKGNNADLRTNGWELAIAWNDAVGGKKPLRYGVKFTLADNKTVVTKYNNPLKNLDDFYEGMVIGEIWGYVTEGLFKDQADIDSHAAQTRIYANAAGDTRPGDVKFKDLDNDHEITPGSNRADHSGDRRIIGNSEPRYTYGVTLNADWNNFFVSVFFQGVGKRDWYPPAETVYFWGQYNRPYSSVPTHILGNYYDADPNNPNPDAYFPRYTGELANGGHRSLSEVQTGYLQDASYIRMKNLTVGYHLPARWIKAFGLQEASVYFTGQNLWTYSGLFKITRNIDPEMIEAINPDTQGTAFGGGNGYPMLMSFTLGINLTF
jgi:TonB-linked SusC/RagA family outer membrane protein